MTHIVSAFDEELLGIQGRISAMGGLAEEVLADALESVRMRDVARARRVIERDRDIDDLEHLVEESVIRIIARRQPLAQDLRVLVAALKLARTLERVGDLAKNIAKRAIPLAALPEPRLTSSVLRMGREVLRNLSDVLNAYAARDLDLAVQIWNRDIEIDEMYNAIFREIVTYMVEDSRQIGHGAEAMFIAKNLERIGDHATHVSEMIHYIVTGENLGGDRPKGNRPGPVGPGT